MFEDEVTFGSLIDEVISELQGNGINQDQFTTLAVDIDPTALNLTVTESEQISKGLIEVDTELMLVSSYGGTEVTIAPWGRGYKGTKKEAHLAGAPVLTRPTYPRAAVGRAINRVITGLWPDLFGVKTVEFSSTSVNWQYPLPAGVDRVLRVEVKPSATDGWVTVSDWDVMFQANTSDFPSGVALVTRRMLSGAMTMRVWYATRPVAFQALTDPYSVSTLPTSCHDVIVYGAQYSLLPYLDTGRLPVEAVEGDALDQARPLGTALNAAAAIQKMYLAAVAREKRALDLKFPPRTRHGR